MSYALDHPNSAFCETLLAVKLAADIKLAGIKPQIIGVVSALPSEGKSVFSKNLGSLISSLGARTLLIDADLRGPELTRRLTPAASDGLIEAVLGTEKLSILLRKEERSGLSFLPAVSERKVSHTSELLASKGMQNVLAQAESDFDYIILDLPPFGPVVDVRAIAPQVQAFVFVVEWRRTARKIVRSILESDESIRQKCLGVVMNKVDTRKLRIYEEYGSRYYYFKKYKSTYYIET